MNPFGGDATKKLFGSTNPQPNKTLVSSNQGKTLFGPTSGGNSQPGLFNQQGPGMTSFNPNPAATFPTTANPAPPTTFFGGSSNNPATGILFGGGTTNPPPGNLFGGSTNNPPTGGVLGGSSNNPATDTIFAKGASEKPAGTLFGSNTDNKNKFGAENTAKPQLFGGPVNGNPETSQPQPPWKNSNTSSLNNNNSFPNFAGGKSDFLDKSKQELGSLEEEEDKSELTAHVQIEPDNKFMFRPDQNIDNNKYCPLKR